MNKEPLLTTLTMTWKGLAECCGGDGYVPSCSVCRRALPRYGTCKACDSMVTTCCEMRDKLLAQMKQDGFYTGFDRHISHEPTTWDINDGYCGDFADMVIAVVEEADEFWLDDITGWEVSHVVVTYRGRYYGAARASMTGNRYQWYSIKARAVKRCLAA